MERTIGESLTDRTAAEGQRGELSMTDDPGLPRSYRGDPGVGWVHIRLPESHICTRRFHRAIVTSPSQRFKTSV
jgi:hypothetical protein